MVTTLTGAAQACCGSGTIRIRAATGNTATIDVLVIRGKPLDFDLLFGIDAIKALGGIRITQSGSVKFVERWHVCALTNRFYCEIRRAAGIVVHSLEVVSGSCTRETWEQDL